MGALGSPQDNASKQRLVVGDDGSSFVRQVAQTSTGDGTDYDEKIENHSALSLVQNATVSLCSVRDARVRLECRACHRCTSKASSEARNASFPHPSRKP
jgi:hypothetical protein